MKCRLAGFLCLIAVLQLTGADWGILQIAAWTGMLVNYSRAEGVEVGIAKTFDGKHHCSLCFKIAKNKETEKKEAAQLVTAKVYGTDLSECWMLIPPNQSSDLEISDSFFCSLDSRPPVPPPRRS
jgi:hypothetical protein